jgi:hypothetical protein
VQTNMKKDLREVYLAPNRASAEVAINVFAENVNRRWNGTPYRRSKGTPLSGEF